MTRKLANKNKKKGEQKQRNKTRIHSLSYLLLHKTKRRPYRRNYGSKNVTATLRQERRSRYRSPRRTCTRRPLTTKRTRPKSKQKRGVQQQENKKTTHRRITRAVSSSSSSPVSTKAVITPAEKGQKYSVKDKNKQQKDRAY